MKTPMPAPIDVPWTMKPLASAKTALTHLEDGRLRLDIEHDLLEGVTPAMLDWWFRNQEGDLLLEGARYPRYRVWHPRDHVAFRYARRPPQGIGPGAVFHIHEVFGRDPRFEIDVLSDVRRLDEGGFDHYPRRFLAHPVHMTYRFTRVAGGTAYVNALIVGLPGAPRWLNTRLVARAFGEDHGRAWLLHNVEEVGNFERFLPALYASARGDVAHAPIDVRAA